MAMRKGHTALICIALALDVTSTAAGASVAAGGTYLGSTAARIEVPYRVSERGADITRRVLDPIESTVTCCPAL
jgi:hypothetical protein